MANTIYLELFLAFLKVGAFTFGGGYAAVPLIRETVLSRGWLDDALLSDLIAVSESTPGPIMVNMATFIGSTQGGFLGAVIATAAVVLPAFAVIILLMLLMKKAMKLNGIKESVNAVKSCTVGIIAATGAFMAVKNVLPALSPAALDIKALILTAVLAAIYFPSKKLFKKGLSPIILILISAAAGIALFGL